MEPCGYNFSFSSTRCQKLVMAALIIVCLALGLFGCENRPKEAETSQEEELSIERLNRKAEEGLDSRKFTPAHPVDEILSDTVSNTLQGAFKAAQSPLVDVGIIEDPIPEELKKYMKNAYALPDPLTCAEILGQIARLDALLGPDQCTPQNPAGMYISEKGKYVDEAAQMAEDRVADTVTGYVNIIPFRSVVRYLSGAESHAREVIKAQQAGIARRSFLKGMAAAHGCREASSAPLPSPLPLAPAASAPIGGE